MDPEGGYTAGAQVSLLKAALRYLPEQKRLELERFEVIGIRSLSTWNRFLHPVSWQLELGALRKRLSASQSVLLGRFAPGLGLSRQLARSTTAYAFVQGSLEVSDRFDYLAAAGIGPRLGLWHDFSERWRTGLSLEQQLFFLDHWRNDVEARLESRLTLGRQGMLGLQAAWRREFGYAFPTVKLYWQHFF